MIRRAHAVVSLVLASLVLAAAHASAAVRKVPQQFTTITAAVTAANDGDTILVSAGTYHEIVAIEGKNDLTLRAHGKVTVTPPSPFTVDGVIQIDLSNRVTLDGFRVECTSSFHGVELGDSDGCTIRDCQVSGADQGFSAFTFASLVVEHCSATDANIGFAMTGSSATLTKCTAKHAALAAFVLQIAEVDVTRCIVIGASTNGIELGSTTTFAIVNDNVVRDCGAAGIAINGSAAGATVSGNRVSGCVNGYFGLGDHVTVIDNAIRGCSGSGIAIEQPHSATVRNRVKKCAVGILLDDSSSSGLHLGNVVTKSTTFGFRLEPLATGNTITQNVAKRSGVTDFSDASGGANDVFDNAFGSGGP